MEKIHQENAQEKANINMSEGKIILKAKSILKTKEGYYNQEKEQDDCF